MSTKNVALTKALAEQHCNRNELDCRWYHGNWALLKSLGVVSSSSVHMEQMQALLQRATPDHLRYPRVLLSGSTDDTLLRIAATAYGDGRQPDITAIDICATPLLLMQQYALDNELTLSTIKTDILDYRPGFGFDIIFTHAFMGNFDENGRARLLRKWSSLLNDGGSVVTVQRIRPADSPPLVRFSGEQSADFISAAMAAARHEKLQPGDEERVQSAASAFTEHFVSHAITSKTSLEELFLDAGLLFHHLEYQRLSRISNITGPSVPSGGEYALIIASKEKQ